MFAVSDNSVFIAAFIGLFIFGGCPAYLIYYAFYLKECPACKEDIYKSATVCRHCHTKVSNAKA